MKSTVYLLSLLVLMSMSCKTTVHSKRMALAQEEKVKKCRSEWKVESSSDTLNLKLLRQDPKGHYDLVSWPNFFIGINEVGDTIGIIEYNSQLIYKRGVKLRFSPSQAKQSIGEMIDSEMDLPVFKVFKKSKENDLYCTVKKVYYGKLIK